LNPRPLGYETHDAHLPHLTRSLPTAPISVNARTEIPRGPPHLPCLYSSRHVSCTNPCTKPAHNLQVQPPCPALQARPPCAADHDVTDQTTSQGTSQARPVLERPPKPPSWPQTITTPTTPWLPHKPGTEPTEPILTSASATAMPITPHRHPAHKSWLWHLTIRQPARTARRHARTCRMAGVAVTYAYAPFSTFTLGDDRVDGKQTPQAYVDGRGRPPWAR